MQELHLKNLFVFGVGMSPAKEEINMLKDFEGADHTNRQAISGLLDAVSASE